MDRTCGHGGKRDGAGRPRQLNDLQRISIGCEYHNRRNDWIRNQAMQRADSERRKLFKLACPDEMEDVVHGLEDRARRLRDVPLAERQKRAKGRPRLGKGEHPIDDCVFDRRHFIENSGGRLTLLHRYIVRPKGLRSELLAAVAAEASQKYGLAISRKMVLKCWLEYKREFQRFDFAAGGDPAPKT